MIGTGSGIADIVGLFDVEYACTLGKVALSVATSDAVVGTFDIVTTLGDGVGRFRTFSALLSLSTISCIVLHVASPVSKLGVIVEGGTVRIMIISVLASKSHPN